MRRFSLRLADNEYEGIEEIAKDLEVSMNDLIREAVRLYLQSHGKK